VVGTTPDGRPVHITLAWPWHFPLATAMTFCLGYLVGNCRPCRNGERVVERPDDLSAVVE
jgi:hypothetical protein